jgi:hypothetical protein
MDALIVIKWISPWKEIGFDKAPSIINTMINIPLKLGSTVNHNFKFEIIVNFKIFFFKEGMALYEAESQENTQFYFLRKFLSLF